MIAAERRYEYGREYYNRYNYDPHRKNRYIKEQNLEIKAKAEARTFGAKEKAKLMFLMFLAGAIAIGLIILTAYGAKVQYNINGVIAQCNKTKGEIQTLSLDIKTCSNIQTIEERAITELGMIYPKYENTVYLAVGGEGVDSGIKLVAGE
ncbi:MAG: hypothetical protein ACOX4U_01805 [Anaerovoracaceae bacterium]|jgi:cell division protein FtsL